MRMSNQLLLFRAAFLSTLLLSAIFLNYRGFRLHAALRVHGNRKDMDASIKDIDGKEMVLWMNPFDSTGFGSEASTIIQGLVSTKALDEKYLWIDTTRSKGGMDGCGDESLDCSNAQLKILAPAFLKWRQWKKSQSYNGIVGVVICHSLPPFWTSSHGSSDWVSCAPCPPLGFSIGVKIGRAMAETDHWHPSFTSKAAEMDEIWVPSQFSSDVLIASGVDKDKVTIIPVPTDTDRFDPLAVEPAVLPLGDLLFPDLQHEPQVKHEHTTRLRGSGSLGLNGRGASSSKGVKDGHFVFLSTFKWEQRKGWDILIDAFITAFKATDSVTLYILTKPNGKDGLSGIREEVKTHLKSKSSHLSLDSMPNIRVVASNLSPEDYVRMYRAADCYVTASRGEGWGMPITEAMSMGLPIISTNWSGAADIMSLDPSIAWPINYTMEAVEKTEATPWWFDQSKWARANTSELAGVMRYAANHPAECRKKGRRAREVAVKKLSITAVALAIGPELERVRKLARERKYEKLDESKVKKELEGWAGDRYRFNDHYIDDYRGHYAELVGSSNLESIENSRSKEGHYDDDGHDSYLDFEERYRSKLRDRNKEYELFTFPPGFKEEQEEDIWGSTDPS